MSEPGGEFARRDRHLFGPGPKRILALDGGGVRGAVTVAFLERIEEILSERREQQAASPEQQWPQCREAGKRRGGDKILLGDWFDLVGGTSTGAVIAGALALGKSTAEVKDFYLRLAPRVFRRPFWRVPLLQAKFDFRALQAEIADIVKDRTLDSADLITGLAVITKRMDTGSPWILANNRKAPYWETKDPTATDKGVIGNKHYKLATLVRASTAAPHFFDPEIVAILHETLQDPPLSEVSLSAEMPPGRKNEFKDPIGNLNARVTGHPWISLFLTKLSALYLSRKRPNRDTHGLFIDGGVTPYNNPALALLMMVVLKPYQLCWRLGPEELTMISIGTGSYRTKLSFAELGFKGPIGLALTALMSLMNDNETLALALMQWLSQCPAPWPVNSEIGSLACETPPGGHWLRFLRYDIRLEQQWLAEALGLNVSEREVKRFKRMDDPGIIKCIYGIARLAAERQVKPEHLFGGAGFQGNKQ